MFHRIVNVVRTFGIELFSVLVTVPAGLFLVAAFAHGAVQVNSFWTIPAIVFFCSVCLSVVLTVVSVRGNIDSESSVK